MKIRPGFVSNSSSSSFILQFDRAITEEETLIRALGYDPANDDEIMLDDWDKTTDKVSNLAKYVFSTMAGNLGCLTYDGIVEVVSSEFDSDTIPEGHDRKAYEAASQYRWEGYRNTIDAVFKKYEVKNPHETLAFTEAKRMAFTLEFNKAQMDFELGRVESDKIATALRNKYIPGQIKKFYDPNKFYYSAEFSDGDGRLGACAEHYALDEFKVMRFSHH